MVSKVNLGVINKKENLVFLVKSNGSEIWHLPYCSPIEPESELSIAQKRWEESQKPNYVPRSKKERIPIIKKESDLECITRTFGKMAISSFLGNSLYATENTQILDRYKESMSTNQQEAEELLKSNKITIETKFQIEILLNPKRHYPI